MSFPTAKVTAVGSTLAEQLWRQHNSRVRTYIAGIQPAELGRDLDALRLAWSGPSID